MYILQIEVSETIPVSTHFWKKQIYIYIYIYILYIHISYNIHSLYDAGMVPNQILRTCPCQNLDSCDCASGFVYLFHRFHNSQPEPIYLHGKSLSVAESNLSFASAGPAHETVRTPSAESCLGNELQLVTNSYNLLHTTSLHSVTSRPTYWKI